MNIGAMIAFLSLMVFTQACGGTHDFSSGMRTSKSSADSTPSPEGIPGGGGPNGENLPGGKDPNGEDLPGETDPNVEDIPKDCPDHLQEILVLDLKSGWWAGDAGDFFTTLLNGLTEPCGNSFRFEFHHVLETSNTYQVFPGGDIRAGSILDVDQLALKKNWGEYSQIWVLSGSAGDPYDMRVSNPVFQGVIAKIREAQVPLFLGSGNGNLTHVNALLGGMGSPSRFATTLPEGPVVDATGSVLVVSRLKAGAELKAHVLFSRGISTIVDAVQTGGTMMRSDYLQIGSDFTSVGDYSGTKSGIAVRLGEGPRIVLDSGLQRFYATKNSEENDTLKYLQNIAVYLSH